MLNVLHGRFVANPAQNSPSHIMKGAGVGVWAGGEKAQMSTVSHWDWIRHQRLTPASPHHPTPAFASSSTLLLFTGQTLWTPTTPTPPFFLSLHFHAMLSKHAHTHRILHPL